MKNQNSRFGLLSIRFHNEPNRKVNMSTLQIEQKIRQLPGYLLPQIMDYVDFLLNKHGQLKQQTKAFAFDWEGGLANLSDQFSSVELQHQAMDWRS